MHLIKNAVGRFAISAGRGWEKELVKSPILDTRPAQRLQIKIPNNLN